jgi:hypothetical protein
MAARHGQYPPELRERALRVFAASSVVLETAGGALGCGRDAAVSGSVRGTADAIARQMTHRPTLPRHLRSCLLEQRFRLPLLEDAGRADARAAQPREAPYRHGSLNRLTRTEGGSTGTAPGDSRSAGPYRRREGVASTPRRCRMVR